MHALLVQQVVPLAQEELQANAQPALPVIIFNLPQQPVPQLVQVVDITQTVRIINALLVQQVVPLAQEELQANVQPALPIIIFNLLQQPVPRLVQVVDITQTLRIINALPVPPGVPLALEELPVNVQPALPVTISSHLQQPVPQLVQVVDITQTVRIINALVVQQAVATCTGGTTSQCPTCSSSYYLQPSSTTCAHQLVQVVDIIQTVRPINALLVLPVAPLAQEEPMQSVQPALPTTIFNPLLF